MRGKVYGTGSKYHAGRITPAYAGKSSHLHAGTDTQQDHPRLCGEKLFQEILQSPSAGSPPPMRGKVYAAVSMPDTVGITPAYAGKSSPFRKNAA